MLLDLQTFISPRTTAIPPSRVIFPEEEELGESDLTQLIFRNFFADHATDISDTMLDTVLRKETFRFFAGVLLRLEFDFFFPEQLAAYAAHPDRIFWSYSLFLAGNIILWPAILTVSRLIGLTKPAWALWGGTMVIFGLFARTFHAGVDHMAFQLVQFQGLDIANKAVADSYGAFHIISILSLPILCGWVVLAIGAWLSGTLGLFRSICLALMSALMIGVLKGSTITSVVATSGLCIALVPLGISVLREDPVPHYRKVMLSIGIAIIFLAICVFIGQAG
jgi:hypothetical protein